MMGVHEKPTVNEAERLVPPSNHGVKIMSIGLLVTDDQPVIWRGPMITKTIQQFLLAVEWGELDFLLVDLPPGTGDAQKIQFTQLNAEKLLDGFRDHRPARMVVRDQKPDAHDFYAVIGRRHEAFGFVDGQFS